MKAVFVDGVGFVEKYHEFSGIRIDGPWEVKHLSFTSLVGLAECFMTEGIAEHVAEAVSMERRATAHVVSSSLGTADPGLLFGVACRIQCGLFFSDRFGWVPDLECAFEACGTTYEAVASSIPMVGWGSASSPIGWMLMGLSSSYSCGRRTR